MNEEEQSLVPKPSNFRRGIGNAISGGYIANLEEANSAQAKQLQDARTAAEEQEKKIKEQTEEIEQQAKKLEEQAQEIQTLKVAEKPLEQREAKIAELEKRLAQLQKEVADAERARDEEYASKDGKMDPEDIKIEEKEDSNSGAMIFFEKRLIEMRKKLDTRVKELKTMTQQGFLSKEELDTETRKAFENFEAETLGCLSAFLSTTEITVSKDLYLKKIQERMEELTSPEHDSDKKHIDSIEESFAESYLDTKYPRYSEYSKSDQYREVARVKGYFNPSEIETKTHISVAKPRGFSYAADVPTMTTKFLQEKEKAEKEHLDREEDL